MRFFFFTFLIFLGLSGRVFAEPVVTYATEGEDASSAHYYFYYSNGERIEKVRWIWNGGAQNRPKVTEYLIGSGAIRIRKMAGERVDIPTLIAGREAKLEITLDYSIGCADSRKMLIPPLPDKVLTKSQRVDLYNLISLLAKDRKPLKDGATPPGDD